MLKNNRKKQQSIGGFVEIFAVGKEQMWYAVNVLEVQLFCRETKYTVKYKT